MIVFSQEPQTNPVVPTRLAAAEYGMRAELCGPVRGCASRTHCQQAGAPQNQSRHVLLRQSPSHLRFCVREPSVTLVRHGLRKCDTNRIQGLNPLI